MLDKDEYRWIAQFKWHLNVRLSLPSSGFEFFSCLRENWQRPLFIHLQLTGNGSLLVSLGCSVAIDMRLGRVNCLEFIGSRTREAVEAVRFCFAPPKQFTSLWTGGAGEFLANPNTKLIPFPRRFAKSHRNKCLTSEYWWEGLYRASERAGNESDFDACEILKSVTIEHDQKKPCIVWRIERSTETNRWFNK